MYKENIKFKVSCPKHKKYNPEGGEGLIKAGCIYCNRLFQLKGLVTELENRIVEFGEDCDRYSDR